MRRLQLTSGGCEDNNIEDRNLPTPGIDDITAGILRKSWPIHKYQITSLMERCMRSCTFSDNWKTANVITLLKSKDKDPKQPKSDRPVSLLQVLSKVLETLIVRKLHTEIHTNCSHYQHGFTTGRSTISAMQSVMEWTDSRSEKNVFGIFLDISGAFNNLKWTKLFKDFVDIGATRESIAIIRNYLPNREAIINIGGSTVSRDLTKGCPQGSQLRPVLWNISMNKVLQLAVQTENDR